MWYKNSKGNLYNIYKMNQIEIEKYPYDLADNREIYYVGYNRITLESFNSEGEAKIFVKYLFHELTMRETYTISYKLFREWLDPHYKDSEK